MYSNKPRKGSVDSIWLTSSSVMKEICKCCRKELGLFSGNIALFRGKCMSCRQKICTDCVVSSLCHKCRVKRHITLNPKDLMNLPSKRLIEISTTLHFHNPQGYEKSELVQLILAIYGCKWKRPIPQEPLTVDDEVPVIASNATCVLCETEPTCMQLVFCQRCTAMLNQPEFLMNLPGRQLQCILKLLKIPEQEMKVREKGELVTLVLARIGDGTIWKPPVPQQPSTSNPQHTPNCQPVNQEARSSETDNSLVNLDSEHLSEHENNGENGEQIFNAAPEIPLIIGAESRFESEQESSSWAHVEHVKDITDESAIQQLKSHQLKSVLRSLDVQTDGFCERNDLVDRVTELWRIWKSQNELDVVDSGVPPAAQEESDNRSQSILGGGKTEIVLPRDVPQLKSLANEEAIYALSVRQLKTILLKHSVNYRGCRERAELAEKVVNLWKSDKRWEVMGEDITDEDTCKICMDAPIDCVLLECGHMVACTECGRQMSECPICREFVVRVVHTFRV